MRFRRDGWGYPLKACNFFWEVYIALAFFVSWWGVGNHGHTSAFLGGGGESGTLGALLLSVLYLSYTYTYTYTYSPYIDRQTDRQRERLTLLNLLACLLAFLPLQTRLLY